MREALEEASQILDAVAPLLPQDPAEGVMMRNGPRGHAEAAGRSVELALKGLGDGPIELKIPLGRA